MALDVGDNCGYIKGMKYTAPVTLDDLRATAKDDKAGVCNYKGIALYYDDATNSYRYWFKNKSVNGEQAKSILQNENSHTKS